MKSLMVTSLLSAVLILLAACGNKFKDGPSSTNSGKTQTLDGGGTSTDNPLRRDISVKFGGFRNSTAARICVAQMQILGNDKSTKILVNDRGNSVGLAESNAVGSSRPQPAASFSTDSAATATEKQTDKQMELPTTPSSLSLDAELSLRSSLTNLSNSVPWELSKTLSEQFEPLVDLQLINTGTQFTDMWIIAGTYKEVIVEVSDSCGTGSSVAVQTPHGSFQTSERIQMLFFGKIEVGATSDEIVLDIQPYIDALQDVRDSSQIRDILESTQSSFF